MCSARRAPRGEESGWALAERTMWGLCELVVHGRVNLEQASGCCCYLTLTPPRKTSTLPFTCYPSNPFLCLLFIFLPVYVSGLSWILSGSLFLVTRCLLSSPSLPPSPFSSLSLSLGGAVYVCVKSFFSLHWHSEDWDVRTVVWLWQISSSSSKLIGNLNVLPGGRRDLKKCSLKLRKWIGVGRYSV